MVFKNAEGDVEEFAHDGAADSEMMELSAFQNGDPRLEGLTPTPSDSGRQVKGFAQKGIADFGKVSFAIKKVTRTEFCRSQPSISGELSSRLELFTGQLGE